MSGWFFVLSLMFSLLLFVVFVISIRRGWIPNTASTAMEIQELKKQVAWLRDERNTLLIEVNQAKREIEELRQDRARLEQEINTLRKQVNHVSEVTILGIWSGDNLDTMAERDAIYDAGFEYRTLIGDAATKANILRELRQGNITVIEIGAHGDADAIFIDQHELTAGWWQRALKNRGIRVAVILACFSDESVADAMKRAGVQHVVAVSGEIEDDAAIEFAQEFYKLFAAGLPVQQAVDEAKLALDYKQAEKLVLR